MFMHRNYFKSNIDEYHNLMKLVKALVIRNDNVNVDIHNMNDNISIRACIQIN